MTYEYYKTLIGEYINCGRSEERLLGEVGFPADLDLEANQFLEAIHIIAAAADNNIISLIKISGLSQTAFGRKLNIPLRTVQSWVGGVRQPPEYISILIGWVLVSDL